MPQVSGAHKKSFSERKAGEKLHISEKELELQLSLHQTLGYAGKVATPLFLKDPLGVMVVSPVSPSDPYTPTRFLKDHVATRLSDSPYMKTRAARRTSYAATLAKETEQKRRHRQQGVKSAIAEGEATSAKEVLQSTQQRLSKMLHTMVSSKEVLDWMSLEAKRSLYSNLQDLRRKIFDVVKSLGAEGSQRPPSMEAFAEASAVIVLKMLMVEVQASVDTLSKVASAADEMLRQDPERLAKADKASLRECQGLAVEVDRLLDDAASLIPLAALKTLEGAKKEFGSKLMTRIGLSGNRVGELELEARVSELFNEMDVDEDGVVDVSEFEKHLAKDGIVVPRKDLAEWIKEVDTDGNRALDLGEFVMLVRLIIGVHNVYVYQEIVGFKTRNGMQNRPKPAPLSLDPQVLGPSPVKRQEGRDNVEIKMLKSGEDGKELARDGKLKYSHLKTPDDLAKRRMAAQDKAGGALIQAPVRGQGKSKTNVFQNEK